MTWPSSQYFASVIVLAFGLSFGADANPKKTPAPDSSATAHLKSPDSHPLWSAPGEQNALDHFKKHGHEFHLSTAQEYVDAVHAFTGKPPKGTLTKARRNGDRLYYQASTNTFAVTDKHGAPRTMFKPDKGRAYYEGQ